MSNAQQALGMVFEVGSSDTVSAAGSAADTFVAVAELTEINPHSVMNTLIDTTTHNNASGFREWTPSGISDMESFTITVNLLESDLSHGNIAPRGLMYLLLNKVKRNVRVRFPTDDWIWAFGCYVEKFAPATPKDGVRTAQITLKPVDYMQIT
jgi:hypothetical protein